MIIENGVLKKVSLTDITEDGKFIIPDGVFRIGNYAFYECYDLTYIAIPKSIIGIGHGAFKGCSGLTSVTIGDGVMSIDNYAFADCSKLTSITIPDSIEIVGGCAFYDCTGLTSAIIGNGVTKIGDAAFVGCSKLASVIIGNSVTRIGERAFYGCTGLTSITIPDSVKSIGLNAFRECSNLATIVIGNGVTNIEMSAFHRTSLESAHKNYKAFRLLPDGGLACLEKEYKIGKRSLVRGILTLCENGIHYCTNLFDIFDYYYGKYGKDFVIAECKVSDEQREDEYSSKKCTRWIIPQRILTREEIIKILNDGRAKK